MLNSTNQDFRGISHVERIVRVNWGSKWQEMDRLNDDGIDGIIFLKRRSKPTPAMVFAQVKCGPAYKKEAKKRPNHIGLQVGNDYIESHRTRWESKTFPVVIIYVDPSSNPKDPESWWADLKSPDSYTSDNKNIIILPRKQKFGPHSKGDFFKLCGPKINYIGLPGIKFKSGELKQGSFNNSLKDNARSYYKHWSNLPSQDRTHPELGEIIVNRVGWRHITRKGRLSLAISQSFEFLPVAARMIKEVTHAKTLRFSVKEVDEQESIFYELLRLDAQIYFPHRQTTVVRVVLKRQRVLSITTGTEACCVWFYSVFEVHKKN